MEITMEVKSQFFDRAAVVEELGKANAAALSKMGAFVRRRARSSMRRRKKASAPGSPPSAHSTSKVATLKNILFAYDRASQSVVIGPLRLNQKQYLGAVLRSGTVPAVHEFGGTMGIREKLENLAPQIKRTRRKGSGRVLSARQKQAMILRKQAEGQPEYIAGTKWIPIGRRKPLPTQPVRVRLAKYPQRAFMGPALVAEAPNFPTLYATSFGGSFMGPSTRAA